MRLSEFDVERYFALTDSDVAAINERFRPDRRAGAAIQLVFLRASGHSLGQVGTLPRQLLHHVGQRSAYRRRRSHRCGLYIAGTRPFMTT